MILHLNSFIRSVTFSIQMLNMSKHKRYFVNNLPDYRNGTVEIPIDEIKNHISEILSSFEKNVDVRQIDKLCDNGLYVGASGISYSFYHLSSNPIFDDDFKESLINKAKAYLKVSLDSTAKSGRNDITDKCSFLLGNAGLCAIGTVLYDKTNMQETNSFKDQYKSIASLVKKINFLQCGSDELFVGRAGYICGALWLAKMLKEDVVPISDLLDVCKAIIASGKQYSKKYRHSSPLMYAYYGTEYLGAAHGLCSILQMIMSVPHGLDDKHDLKVVRETVDYLLSLQMNNGNFPCAMDEIAEGSRSEEEELVHWCHGAPGVVYLMAKAYVLWKDEKYLRSCMHCGEIVWQKGLLKKGPGICHGVAGSGYVFLLLYRLTKEPKHLHRAIQFARFMTTDEFKRGARRPDSLYSLYEGYAGTLCFLSDLLQPDTAAFPFMDVF